MILEKEFSFATGHRLHLHKGHCFNFHGHNYDILVKITTESNDYIEGEGFVIDFGEIKKIVKEMYDHKLIIHKDDEYAIPLSELKLPGLVIVNYQPTAENMAVNIAQRLKTKMNEMIEGSSEVTITLWETKDSSATATA